MRRTHRTAKSASASTILESIVGPLYLAASDEGLTHLLFVDEMSDRPRTVPAASGSPAGRILREAVRQLREYFAGKRRAFDVLLAPEGTPFQCETWRGLRTIGYGETVSYAELARRVGKPGAARAVGMANGANPIAIIVPCHRVIGADGTLTGYGGGLHVKQALLELEGVSVRSGRRPPRGRNAPPSPSTARLPLLTRTDR
ncbi:MAG: methylated-DNA--[protein]-cysteine S-methyltransferase [Acidobacteriota bacterium]|nr:MAG: methylated-DNA--[protein]-cysteine S-methyltransferase [Acidobacteriota bacterium]